MHAAIMVLWVLWLVALTGYDIGQRRLPNWLTLPGAGVILLAAAVSGRGVPALLGALALATMYLAVHLATPKAMGAGDVKLAIGLGALTGCFGAEVWFLAAVAAPLLTAASGVVMWSRGVRAVPHGPSMCLASGLAVGLALV